MQDNTFWWRCNDISASKWKKVYDKDVVIQKEVCLNHVANHLGTSLRNKVKEYRAKGVTLCGRKPDNLTEATIVKMQNFYRKALLQTCSKWYHIFKWHFFNACLQLVNLCTRNVQNGRHHGAFKTVLRQTIKHEVCTKPWKHNYRKKLLQIMLVYQRLASNEILMHCVSEKTQKKKKICTVTFGENTQKVF